MREGNNSELKKQLGLEIIQEYLSTHPKLDLKNAKEFVRTYYNQHLDRLDLSRHKLTHEAHEHLKNEKRLGLNVRLPAKPLISSVVSFFSGKSHDIPNDTHNRTNSKEIALESFHIVPHPPTFLLDVDDTLLNTNGEINWNLIDALEKTGVTQVYLFTSFSLSAVKGFNLVMSMGEYAAFRKHATQSLEERHISVSGVITTLDPYYGGGLGSFYEEVCEKYETELMEKGVLTSERDYQDDLERIENPLFDQQTSNSQNMRLKIDMLNFAKQELGEETAFIIIDDNQNIIEQMHQEENISPISAIKSRDTWKTTEEYSQDIRDAYNFLNNEQPFFPNTF